MTYANKPVSTDAQVVQHTAVDNDTLAHSAAASSMDAVLSQYAYEHLLPEYRAIPSASVLRITGDISYAAIIAHRAAEQLIAIRSAFTRDLRDFDPGQFERLRTLALGAWFAARQARPMDSDTIEYERLVAEGNVLREHFLIAANALVARKLFDAETLADMKEACGHRDLAKDLSMLASLFDSNESRYAGRTSIDTSEVQRAGEIARALVAMTARRVRNADSFTTAAAMRQRAWTLLVHAYDDVRRAVSYVRWAEGDADHIAPSLFAIPGSERRGVSDHPKHPRLVTSNRTRESGVQSVVPGPASHGGSGIGNPRV